jgi:hypothetical protein
MFPTKVPVPQGFLENQRVTADHMTPRVYGGKGLGRANIVYSCSRCNTAKGCFPYDVFKKFADLFLIGCDEPAKVVRGKFADYYFKNKKFDFSAQEKIVTAFKAEGWTIIRFIEEYTNNPAIGLSRQERRWFLAIWKYGSFENVRIGLRLAILES